MNKKKDKLIYVNFIILTVAALVYLALIKPAEAATSANGAFPVYRAASADKVSIQCAVDWDASSMDLILDELDSAGVRITFAVSGEWVAAHGDTLKRIVSSGSEAAVLADGRDGGSIGETADLIESLCGARPVLCVFKSECSAASMKAAGRAGLAAVRCTVDLDTANGTAAEILERVGGITGGGCIISVSPTRETAKALHEMIEKIKNMGFDIVPTHKMLYN